MRQTTNHYTFGTSDLAAHRLVLLAQAYDRPTRAFLSEWRQEGAGVEHAVDLGCGLGLTTELLHTLLRPGHMTGIDASESLLGAAAARLPAQGIAWLHHDITVAPFPCAPADLLFCRFLATHLDDPAAAFRAWSVAAQPDAVLLVQETARLESDEPALARYYDMVGRLQAAYGQSLHVGEHLDQCFEGTGWSIASSRCRTIEQPAAVMAELHALNILTWSRDAKAAALFSPTDIASVQLGLALIASGERPARPVRNVLREIVATKTTEGRR